MSNFAELPMGADEMLAEARRLTDIDIVDEAAREPLSVLIDSFNKEAGFTEKGALAKHDYLMRFLKNRLRMQRDFAAHPEIKDIELKPPIIINALPRTGSTKLQKVLAATGDLNWLPMWTAMNPASWTGRPHEDTAPRIADVEDFVEWFSKGSPEANAGHAMNALEPEEDSYVMMHSLVSQTLSGYANAPSYVEWYFTQDESIQFNYVRDTLRYLVWQGLADPDKPFVLKSAMSVGFENGLIEAHPDAKLVMTHRDPKQLIPSSCKLIEVFRLPFSDQPFDPAGVAPGMSMLAGQHIAFRGRRPDIPILDIDYRQLRDDAAAVVETIFDFAGLTVGPATLANVHKWEQANPKNRHGAFSYTFEQFGTTPEEIDTAFADYIQLAASKGIDFSK